MAGSATVTPFESRESQLNSRIDAEVAAFRAAPKLALPTADATIVQTYVQKIQGTYDVDRAKRDTDNAIDLLYIAYNTTPQEEGDVRVRISALMNKLITTQQKSELTMQRAMHVSTGIGRSLGDVFPDWLDVREGGDQAEIKDFATKDLVTLAKSIRDEALTIRDRLLDVAATYDDIIKDTVEATNKSEVVLGARIKDKQKIEDEISAAKGKREALEGLVSDLREEVRQFDEKARQYEQQAATAEQRAFVMSIVRVGAQMISSAVPAIAMAAGGPAGMLASSAGGALNGHAGGRPAGDAQSADGGQGADRGQGGAGGNPADSAHAQTQLSEGKLELQRDQDKAAALKTDIAGLEASKAHMSEGGESEEAAKHATEVAALDERIKAKRDDLKTQDDAVARQQAVVDGLQASLAALDRGLGQITTEQKDQATTLRDMQMKMIEKAESYEKERRDQSAELVKITALLKGKQTDDEIIQLAIKSLNVSLSALKRMKEIVEEIAFFFKSFADFMQGISDDAGRQVDSIDAVANLEKIRKNRLEALVRSVDEFFVRQTAQWYAVTAVSDRFTRSFADGWSKLNKLSGNYITGDQLKAYLETASAKLSEIVQERDAAANQRIASLNAYRETLAKQAAGAAPSGSSPAP